MMIFGGKSAEGVLEDVAVYDYASNQWESIATSGTPPRARHSHAAARVGSEVFVFGGVTRDTSGIVELCGAEVYALNTVTWTWREIPPPHSYSIESPSVQRTPCYSHSATTLACNPGTILVVGGAGKRIWGAQRVWTFNTCTAQWRLLTTLPQSLLMRHTATVIGDRLFITGGGGVCFAFGVRYNPTFRINLSKLIK
eukprot:105452_1